MTHEPGSKLVVLGMAIPPLIGNPCNGYINPYYWVDDHPLLYGNNGSLDPRTHEGLWGSPTKDIIYIYNIPKNPGGDCYWAGEQPKI